MAASRILSIKLLIDSKTNRVVFAEARKEFVDFLLNFLSLPVASVIQLVTTGDMAGSVGNIYRSIDTIGDTFMLSRYIKNSLSNPTVPALTKISNRLLGDTISRTPKKLFKCNSSCKYMGSQLSACPGCSGNMYSEINLIDPKGNVWNAESAEGFVKDAVAFMIMDDLMINPITTLTMLERFKVEDVGSLEVRFVDVGVNEGLKLLKASLHSKTVLSDVFLAEVDKSPNLKSEV